MRQVNILATCGAIALFALSTSISFAGEITLSALQVKNPLKAGKPYQVKLQYKKTGKATVVRGCFLWSGEGPYCFPVDVRTKTIRATLRTNNPNTYRLGGFVEYKSGGKTINSNRVSTLIEVKR